MSGRNASLTSLLAACLTVAGLSAACGQPADRSVTVGAGDTSPSAIGPPVASSAASTVEATSTSAPSTSVAFATTPTPVVTTTTAADWPDTLDAPARVASADGKAYFVYGTAAGDNNRAVRRVIVSLPGHGTLADTAYGAWSPHLDDGRWALAEFNWWDGAGETKADYYPPAEIVTQLHAFLAQQGYGPADAVVLHGFSRGSANSYAVLYNDRLSGAPVIDAVISNAGRYEADFPLATPAPSDGQVSAALAGVPWVLSCGGRDPNVERSGCAAMEDTGAFLSSHGANVLGLLSDPNGDHGAFHRSSLGLPAQALALIDTATASPA